MYKRPHLHLRAATAPVQRAELRSILRTIARCAVFGSAAAVGGCSGATQEVVGQTVPTAGARNGGESGRGQTLEDPTTERASGAGDTPSPTAGAGAAPTVPMGGGDPSGVPNPDVAMASEPVPCDNGLPQLLGNIAYGAPGPDALTRLHSYREALAEEPVVRVQVVEAQGAPCAGAIDRRSCERAYDAVVAPDAPCPGAECGPALVGTVGDDVHVATATRGDLSTLLGAIDTVDEAALVAWLHQHPFACGQRAANGEPVSVEAVAGGFLVRYAAHPCGEEKVRRVLRVTSDGGLTVEEEEILAPVNCDVGRRPQGLRAPPSQSHRSVLGRYLADMARLEAASVVSFVRLARELKAFDAPAALVEGAIVAAADEVRHARVAGALCLRFGGRPGIAEVAAAPLRSRFSVALDNAVEGCVRETYGALLATCQAMTASDPAVRGVMTMIAEDETRHADLSWKLARFLEPQLTAAERASLRVAQAAAVAQLARQLDPGLSPRERDLIGYPDPAVSAQLLTRLTAALLPGASPTDQQT